MNLNYGRGKLRNELIKLIEIKRKFLTGWTKLKENYFNVLEKLAMSTQELTEWTKE